MKSAVLIDNYGCRIISGGADIIIDPSDANFGRIPDGVIFSCPQAAGAKCLNQLATYETTPVYTAAVTKKLLNLNFIKYGSLTSDGGVDKRIIEEIISCRQKAKNVLRKQGQFKSEIIFLNNSKVPGEYDVFIKTASHSIVYANTPSDKVFPKHDILIINANKKAPAEQFLRRLPKAVIKAENFSGLYTILDYFNCKDSNIKVGVDETVSTPACEYLKMDCTVFSKNVRPLSSFKKTPSVIISAKPENYKSYTVLPSSLFGCNASLYDIYKLAANSYAKKIIVITNKTHVTHKRGNIFFCQSGALEL